MLGETLAVWVCTLRIPPLVPGAMILRPATMHDAKVLYEWRNDPDTRSNSITTDPVPWNDHLAWLETSLSNPSRQLLIAEVGGRPVGTVRIDDALELSWTVAPQRRGQGVGRKMVSLVCSKGHIARIKRENVASRKIAASIGFEMVSDGDVQEWRLND